MWRDSKSAGVSFGGVWLKLLGEGSLGCVSHFSSFFTCLLLSMSVSMPFLIQQNYSCGQFLLFFFFSFCTVLNWNLFRCPFFKVIIVRCIELHVFALLLLSFLYCLGILYLHALAKCCAAIPTPMSACTVVVYQWGRGDYLFVGPRFCFVLFF